MHPLEPHQSDPTTSHLGFGLAVATIFACDMLAYLLFMGRLGLAGAGIPIIIACVLRAFFVPAIRILASVAWSSKAVRNVVAVVLSIALYGGILIVMALTGIFLVRGGRGLVGRDGVMMAVGILLPVAYAVLTRVCQFLHRNVA